MAPVPSPGPSQALLVLTFSSLFALSACEGAKSITGVCSFNRDCGSGERCVSGECIAASMELGCTTNGDCAIGEECSAGLCTPVLPDGSCATSSDCPSGQTCDVGVCKDETPVKQSCTADGECGADGLCLLGQCAIRCDRPGATACPSGSSCDTTTGRCGASASCSMDSECGAPAGVCEGGRCVAGCSSIGGLSCRAGTVCDSSAGRCVNLQGPCSDDQDCGPPTQVCEGGQCVGGCAQAGGFQCSGATSCNPATGRCGAGGPFCANDTECSAGQVCDLLTGICEAGCQSAGCTGGQTCQPSGHCSSRTCVADNFEPNDSRAAATALAIGNYGALSLCGSDQDFYHFDLLTGDPIEIQALFRHAEGDINLELYGPSNQVVASAASTTDNESLSLAAPADGRYVLRVFMTQDLGPDPGNTYSLDLALDCAEDALEPNDTEATARATTLPMNQPNLALCPENSDFYAIQAAAGQNVSITVRFSDADGDIDLRLYDPSGFTVASSGSTSNEEQIDHLAEDGGRYVLEVFLFGDSGRQPGNRYDLEIQVGGTSNPPPPPTCADDRFEPNDTEGTAASISDGLEANLRICSGDQDFYRFNANAGDDVRVDLFFSNAEGDIDADITGPSGSVVASGVTSTDDETLEFTAVTSGTYTLWVNLFSDLGTMPGNDYDLELQIGGTVSLMCTPDAEEPNDTAATAPAIWPGSLPALSLCPGDEDYYTIGLVIEDRVTVDLSFTHAEGNIDLSLIGPAGTVVASSATSNDGESFTYVVAQSGLHRIRARLTADTGSAPGNDYDMNVSLIPPASCQPDSLETNDSSSSPRAILPGGYLSLTSCESDDDWYGLSLSAGVTYTFAALFTHAEGDVDIGLFDAAGTVVASSVTELDDEIFEFTPTTSGTYRFLVRLFEDAGSIPGNRYDMVVLDQ